MLELKHAPDYQSLSFEPGAPGPAQAVTQSHWPRLRPSKLINNQVFAPEVSRDFHDITKYMMAAFAGPLQFWD